MFIIYSGTGGGANEKDGATGIPHMYLMLKLINFLFHNSVPALFPRVSKFRYDCISFRQKHQSFQSMTHWRGAAIWNCAEYKIGWYSYDCSDTSSGLYSVDFYWLRDQAV